MNRRALIVVDPQNDFMPGGSLAVAGGDEIVPEINRMVDDGPWDLVVVTRDWHPVKHCSFRAQGGLWAAHCVAETFGAQLAAKLSTAIRLADRNGLGLAVIDKGCSETIDSYSAFFDNERRHETELNALLKLRGIDEIFVCGLATDVCVKATVLDALDLRLPTTVIIDACRAVNINPGDEKKALVEMARAGAKLTVVDNLPVVDRRFR